MIPLTQELRAALKESTRVHLRVCDPETQREYVVIQADVFERMRQASAAEAIDPSFYEFDEKPIE